MLSQQMIFFHWSSAKAPQNKSTMTVYVEETKSIVKHSVGQTDSGIACQIFIL